MKGRKVTLKATITVKVPNYVGKRFLRMIGETPYIYAVYEQLYFQNGTIVLRAVSLDYCDRFDTADLNQNWEVPETQD